MSRISRLVALGQSLWMDNIQRRSLENGDTKSLIDRGDIRGMTSNPTIFNQAISGTHDYDEALRALAWSGWDAEKIFWELAVHDIRSAADLFAPLYERTDGGDGYVSIEVNPLYARDTEKTLAQAQQLWARVARPNLMVKIPATHAGIPAIRRAIALGLNINVTLIFSRDRYAEVVDAYMAGLEDRLAGGLAAEHIASVASFFVSRVDTKVDGMLPPESPLLGKAAIANAKLAYDDFQKAFSGDRWRPLRAKGALPQRPLWASTGTKNRAYPDTLYVDSLVGPDTVNTLPPKTLDAFRDHGRVELSITRELAAAIETMAALEKAGIDMALVTRELEAEGVDSFSASFTEVLENIESRRRQAVDSLGPLVHSVVQRVDKLAVESVPTRLWAHDPTLWTDDPVDQAEIAVRMGWMESPQKARALIPEYQQFAEHLHTDGLRRFLVLGMGGSSLAAEVFSSMFSSSKSAGVPVRLGILDSTDPSQVAETAERFPPDMSLYLVASKSGGTAEATAAFDFFWSRSDMDASRFVAITDEDTSLDMLARKLRFRRLFTADSTVGGRYSALTAFGLVPAALLGVDIAKLVDRAEWMQSQNASDVPAARSPGITLGAVLAESALAGRDKLTLLADPAVSSFANWIEQLVAESSGKEGRGIIPVALEPLDLPDVYGQDRIFVYLRRDGGLDVGVGALSTAGHPVLVFDLPQAYDVGAEIFRWEVAISVACHVLGVNAFDQPNVQESKDRTAARIEEFRRTRTLSEGAWDIDVNGLELSDASAGGLKSFVSSVQPGGYVAINAYLPRDQRIVDELQRLRVAIRELTQAAVTVGFGPRFQHSTGQLHKGGPDKGVFVQVVYDASDDLRVPSQDITFGTLIRAQALGDYEALVRRKCRILRVHLGRADDVVFLRRALA